MDLALCRSHLLLRDFPPTALSAVLQRCTVRELAPGETLLIAGQENHTVFFLLAGELEVHLHTNRDAVDRFLIRPGEIVGEMSIIERRPVGAQVNAGPRSVVLAMPEEVFWSEYCSRTELVPSLLRSLASRIRRADAVLRQEFERHVRYEVLQKELESAARIQANILPTVAPLYEHPSVDLHPLFRPARAVGGDFYDVVRLGRDRVAVAIGDVSGKGMPAALFMVRTLTLLRMILLRAQEPAAILPELNRQLCAANDEFMFVTLALLLLDPDTGRVVYLNGGHNPVLIAGPNEPFAPWPPPTGPLLGVNVDSRFELRERTLRPGETIVLYTDGITEAENERQEQFGLQRTAERLSQPDQRTTAKTLVAALNEAVSSFVGAATQSDDITALALTYRGLPFSAAKASENAAQAER